MAKKPDEKKPDETEAALSAISADSAGDPSKSLIEQPAKLVTGAMASEIVIRSVGSMVRQAFERGVLSRRYDKDTAKKFLDNRSVLHTAAAFGVTKIATRSLPGALLVGTGLVAKTLFDRGKARRTKRKGGPPSSRRNDEN